MIILFPKVSSLHDAIIPATRMLKAIVNIKTSNDFILASLTLAQNAKKVENLMVFKFLDKLSYLHAVQHRQMKVKSCLRCLLNHNTNSDLVVKLSSAIYNLCEAIPLFIQLVFVVFLASSVQHTQHAQRAC